MATNPAASPSYRLPALPVARAAAWEMKSEVAGSHLQFQRGRFFPGECRHSSAGSLTAISFGRTRNLPPGAGPQQGRARRGREAAGSGWGGPEPGAATLGGQERRGPRTAEAKHSGRGGRRAWRGNRGPAANPGQTEPASAIYFRELNRCPEARTASP